MKRHTLITINRKMAREAIRFLADDAHRCCYTALERDLKRMYIQRLHRRLGIPAGLNAIEKWVEEDEDAHNTA